MGHKVLHRPLGLQQRHDPEIIRICNSIFSVIIVFCDQLDVWMTCSAQWEALLVANSSCLWRLKPDSPLLLKSPKTQSWCDKPGFVKKHFSFKHPYMFRDAYLIKFELFIVECKGVFFNLIIVFASIVHCVIHSWWLVSSPAIFLAGYIWWSNQRVIFMIRVLPGLACNELCIRTTHSHHQMQSGASTRHNLGTVLR